jgi:hypothetical protein
MTQLRFSLHKENPIVTKPKRNPSSNSVFSPPVTAGHALVETRHGLISTANLNLEESCLVAFTSLVGALNTTLLRIVPSARTAKDVLLLDTLIHSSRKDGLGDVMFERAGSAFETVGSCTCEGDGEDVCAMGADWSLLVWNRHIDFGALTEQHDDGCYARERRQRFI